MEAAASENSFLVTGVRILNGLRAITSSPLDENRPIATFLRAYANFSERHCDLPLPVRAVLC